MYREKGDRQGQYRVKDLRREDSRAKSREQEKDQFLKVSLMSEEANDNF